ncbi:MAG: transposase [Candidatus Hydrogenedentes bacterium]|nr:transposase [Candidatus Hydrogenedentota bacterium]
MPREKRNVLPGVAHHITHRGNNKQAVFHDDDDRHRYLHLLKKYADTHGVRVLAYCLMTNHIHIVGIPAKKDSLAALMKRSQLEHAKHINEKYAQSGHLWAGRFYSCPMDLDHTQNALGYVELNPVRAGMITCPCDYPWSSAAGHCGMRDDSLVNLQRWFENYTAIEWREALRIEAENRGFVEQIREHTRKGKPLGSRAYFRRYE